MFYAAVEQQLRQKIDFGHSRRLGLAGYHRRMRWQQTAQVHGQIELMARCLTQADVLTANAALGIHRQACACIKLRPLQATLHQLGST